MAYGIIYKATHVPTGRCYIGQTTQSFRERITAHYYDANYSKRKRKTYFQRALAKYNREEFNWEVIDTADNATELDEKECRYITDLNTRIPKRL